MKKKIFNKNVVLMLSFFLIALVIFFYGIVVINNNVLAAWKEDEKGKSYILENGEDAVGFETIDDKKYYFDEEGYLKTGKIYIENEDAYYYADEDGVILTGVIKNDKVFYVADDNGKIQVGFVEYDGKRYYFNKRAEQLFGWFEIDEDWYYADKDGIVKTGMITVDEKRYYLDAEGKRVKDTVMEIDGVTYIFSADGSVDENATMLYPVYSFISQYRTSNGLTDILMNKKVAACAAVRAAELVNGYGDNGNGLELMLQNRGIKCMGGYEFSYGGTEGYGIDQLIENIKIDDRFISALKDSNNNISGIGMHVEENKTYFDIIIIAEQS